MSKPKNVFKFLVKAGIIIGYIGLIVILILQALTPGSESSDISNSVGDKFDEIATGIQKPEVDVVSVEDIKILSLTVGKNEYDEDIILYIGQSGTVDCKVYPSDATNPSLSYSSSDGDVLSVYPSGKFVAEGVGTATITVSSIENDDIADKITVTVSEIAPEKIEIDNIPTELHVEEKHMLEVEFTPKNTSDKSVTWESSDKSVLSVSKSGSLTAKKEGTATITVTSVADPTLTASVEITVLPKSEDPIIPAESLTVKADESVGYIGSTLKLSAALYPADADGKIEWYSSNEKIATVSQKGVVTCIAAGSVTITAKCGDTIEDSISITVKEVLSENIYLEFDGIRKDGDGDGNAYALKQGESGKVIATLDENATIFDITYSSSDESVARIGADGVIEALSGGSTTITVSTSYDGEVTEVSFLLNIERITLKDTIENFYYIIRKSIGHFGAFLVLGFLGSFTYYIIFKKDLKGKLLAFAVNLVAGFAVAGITEILQLPYFTQGRYCSFDDVLLDFSGYCTSSIPIYLVIILWQIVMMIVRRIRGNK